MYAYRKAFFRLISGIVRRSHDNRDLSHIGRNLLCRYGKCSFGFQAYDKIFLQGVLRTIVHPVSHGSQSCRNGIFPVILHSHGNRRHFFIFLRQCCTAVYRKRNLRRIVLYNDTMNTAAVRTNGLRIRNIAHIVRGGNPDLSLKVRGDIDYSRVISVLPAENFFHCRLTCGSTVFRISGFRDQCVIHIVYAASRLYNRNGDFKAVFADNPVPEIFIAFVKGRIPKLWFRRVKFCGQGICHRFVTGCIHRLEGIGVFSLFQSVKKELILPAALGGAAFHGKFDVSAAVLLNRKSCYSFIVRIRKLDGQFPIPFSCVLMICRYCVKFRLCYIPPFRIKGHVLRQIILVCFARKMPSGGKSIITIPAIQDIPFLHRILWSADRILPCLSGNQSNRASAICIKGNGQRSAFRNRYLSLLSVRCGICSFHPNQDLSCRKA